MRKQLYISLLAAILALPLLTRAEEVVVDTVEISLSRDIENVDSLSDASSDDDMSSAVDVSRSRDIETSDVVSDDVDSVPEWYVPAEIPEALRSPMRTAAAACLTDSVLTFNIDSVLTTLRDNGRKLEYAVTEYPLDWR